MPPGEHSQRRLCTSLKKPYADLNSMKFNFFLNIECNNWYIAVIDGSAIDGQKR